MSHQEMGCIYPQEALANQTTALTAYAPEHSCGLVTSPLRHNENRTNPKGPLMPVNVAAQMDHIASINIAGDSTFTLLLEAQKRGFNLHHYTPDTLRYEDGRVSAKIQPLHVKDDIGSHFQLGPETDLPVDQFDVILLRQDPPFDLAYITSTHLLEMVHPATLVVNDPAAVRNAPEKILVLQFQHLMPPTLITRSLDEVRKFKNKHHDIILKPLHGHGGQNVFRLRSDDENLAALTTLFQSLYREPFMVQRYLPEVRAGDKRILLIDGEPVGAINRLPASQDTRSNLAQGGSAEATNLTPRELEICATIGPELRARSLTLVGIDVIGDYLTEINVTSPTGLRTVEALGGASVAHLFWDSIERKLSQKCLTD